MSYLGIDLGTSGSRVAAYSLDGTELAASSVKNVLLRPAHARVELDAEKVLASIVGLVRDVVSAPALQRDPVHAISFSALGEAVVPVDDDDRPLGPAPVSMDGRGAGSARTLGLRLGGERVQRITGQPLHPMFSVHKLGDLVGKSASHDLRAVATLDEFVARRLGAKPLVDYTMAARTGGFDVDRREWSDEILAALDISPRLLSPTAPAGTVRGLVSAEAAAATGLAQGTPLVLGVHDQAAAFLGGGGAATGPSVFSFGSSDCLTVGATERPKGLIGSGFATYPVSDDLWITLAGTAAGGWALEWFAKFVDSGDPGEWSALYDVADVPPPALIVLPYLAGSGTLDNDPLALGALLGLTLETTTSQVARAFLEASGYELAKIREALAMRDIPPAEVNAVGSGSASPAALQARANAAGLPLRAVAQQASSRGAAMLAAKGVGAIADVHSIPEPPTLHASTPEPAYHSWYERQRATFASLYPTLKPINDALKEAV